MPKSCFWALDRSGQMFYLNLNDMKWRTEKPNVAKQSFKKLSAQEHCAWGIGANQRVYMCVFASDIPIRVQESCFENQRWSMLQGWSAKAVSCINCGFIKICKFWSIIMKTIESDDIGTSKPESEIWVTVG